jgi:hypothetical protein
VTTLFDRSNFDDFCRALRVNTKERGLIRLGDQFLGTQKRVLLEMQRGFDKDIHDFIVLKCRQIGMSTLTLAMDLYWIQKFKGIQGVLVSQDDGTRDSFRATLQMYYDGLPEDYRVNVTSHNVNQLVLSNTSMLLYRVAGTRKTGGSGNLGRSASPSLIHGTEVSSWADPEGLASLRNAMSETSPRRLYVWESTARGFNMFYNMWQAAKNAVSQRAIFVSWWANELYRAQRNGNQFEAYWGGTGRMSQEEKRRAREVKLLYSIELTPEQVAWYRWYETEKCSGNELMAMQEMPWTEHEAFIATGSKYFTSRIISALHKRVRSLATPQLFQLRFFRDFHTMRIEESNERQATLRVWEEPVKGAYYVLGADPAYGSSEHADRFVVSVWRCYADRIVQVCEFVDPDLAPHQFAWAMVYLAGAFDPCLVNLEINGPGAAVWTEVENLRKQVMLGQGADYGSFKNIIAKMRTYLWRRIDSITGGPTAKHTKTTASEIERYMGIYKDYVEREMAEVCSQQLVDEMQEFERDDGGSIGASDRAKDDAVIAAALAVTAWNDALRGMLMTKGLTYAASHGEHAEGGANDVTRYALNKMFQRVGIVGRPDKVIPGVRYGVPPTHRSGARR